MWLTGPIGLSPTRIEVVVWLIFKLKNCNLFAIRKMYVDDCRDVTRFSNRGFAIRILRVSGVLSGVPMDEVLPGAG